MAYRFIGIEADDEAGHSVASAGDVDGDGKDDLIIGAYLADGGHRGSGEAYLVLAADLVAADAADGTMDEVINLDNVNGHTGSYQFIGTEIHDYAGCSVASAGDVDDDGKADLIIGAYGADGGGWRAGEAYLVSAADMAAADAADGATDGVIDLDIVHGHTGSYRFIGGERGDEAGSSVASAGDVDGDGADDLIIGANKADGIGSHSGEAHLVLAADLAAADAADGTTDGVIDLDNVKGHTGSYQFIGARPFDFAGHSVASAGDVDGDGKHDLIIGAPVLYGGGSPGEAYLVLAADLAAADAPDGTTEGVIDLDNVNGHTGSYRFIGAEAGDLAGHSVASAGDVDGDGKDDLIIGAPFPFSGGSRSGKAYLISAADLATADAADGNTDGMIDLDNVNGHTGSYRFIGRAWDDEAGSSVASAGDVDGDGKDDLSIGAVWADGGGIDSGEAYLITAVDLAAADAADGATDGVIDLDNANGHTGSYRFIGAEAGDLAGRSVASAGDVDGDGKDDLIIGAPTLYGGGSQGEAYLIAAADLAVIDAADGTIDGVIELGNVAIYNAAVAQDDAFAMDEVTALSGSNVFDDNGSGPDTDVDTPLRVSRVNGVATSVGVPIVLASGALLELGSDGTFDYDPNGRFEYLPLGSTGIDSFTYEVNGDAAAKVTITINGIDNNDVFVGTSSDDVFDGGIGNDTFTGGGGNDMLQGGKGIDLVREAGDFDFTITPTQLTGNGRDSLQSIERAHLIGGANDNIIDASGFANGFVTLEGMDGNDTLISPDATGEGEEDEKYFSFNMLLGGAGDDTLIGGTGLSGPT